MVGTVVVVLVLLGGATAAGAHQPVFVDDLTPAGDAPTLDDGTISFAVYGTVRGPERQAGVQARFAAGDPLVVELLIPDLAPENALAERDLPRVAVVSPSGATTELVPDRREPFTEPFSATSYLRIAGARTTAEAGTYVFTVTAAEPSRFTLAIGEREVPGTVSGYSQPAPGALEAWYSTPPSPAGADEPVLDAPGAADPGAGANDLDPSRFAGGGLDDSTPGRAAGLPLALGAAIILGVVVTAVVRGRRARVAGAQLREGSGPQ